MNKNEIFQVQSNFASFAGENINTEINKKFEEGVSTDRVFRCVRDPQSVYLDIIEQLKKEDRDDDRCIADMLLLCAVCLGCKDFFKQRHLRSRLRSSCCIQFPNTPL